MPMRVNKYIAKCINISRRKADEYIKNNLVKVNGEIIQKFIDIDENVDIVEVDGKVIKLSSKQYYFAFYKPPFVLSATQDDSQKSVVCDYFKDIKEKLICVGRLDYLSEGLLLVTNDGEFANIVMHPKFKIRKTYLVKTKNRLSKELINKMSKGITLSDGFFKPIKMQMTDNPFWVLVSIDTGRNRIVRRFFSEFGVSILKLKRISIGNIELGDLKSGEYRNLSESEIQMTKKISKNQKNLLVRKNN